MILPLTIFILCCAVYGEFTDWKDKSVGRLLFTETDNELEKERCLDPQNEFCKNSPDLVNLLTGHFLKKKGSSYSFSGTPNAKIVPFFQTLHQCPSSCKMDYHLLDLGQKYFPRYLQSGVCKRDSCGSHHKCMEKKYKVTVIRQKDISDQDVLETRGLPSNLQDSWVSDSVSISIACECILNM